MRSCLAMVVLAMASQSAQSSELSGLSFSHNDWELVCDNTRTCRAAGYQNEQGEQEERPVSVLLTRNAGPRQPVTGELMITIDNEPGKLAPPELKLSMLINERDIGQVTVHTDTAIAKLSATQVTALLAALSRNSNIEWVAGEDRWHLSDKGATAMLLKMDELQGRVGTKGALVNKGTRGEEAVLAPLPVPVVIAAPLAKPLPTDKQWATDKSKALLDAFHATITDIVDDDCDLEDTETGEAELSTTRLTDAKLLVSTKCWSGAYNMGYGYWVVDDTPPYHPVLVTTSGSEYSEGSISAAHKGRGIGDCWSSDEWTWDGKQFVHTGSSSTGMCKLFPGGAWSLPSIKTDVRNSPR
ncbi:MAG: DUF1176 domain-containing protein [Methylotenera sp.]